MLHWFFEFYHIQIFLILCLQDISLEQLNSETFSSICYYLLGIIDTEERDKLMKWPLTNIQSRTKFRKGLSAMIKNFQDKFPWANTKKLPGYCS